MSELSSEVVKVDIPTVKDLTQPKKVMKKGVGIIELGLGGIAEKQFVAPLAAKIPIPTELTDTAELIALGLINESVDHADVNNFVSGAIVSCVTRLSDKLIERIKSMMKMKLPAAQTAIPAISSGAEEQYLF